MLVAFQVFDLGDLVLVKEELAKVLVLFHVFNLADLIVRQVDPLKGCRWIKIKHFGESVAACVQLQEVLEFAQRSECSQTVTTQVDHLQVDVLLNAINVGQAVVGQVKREVGVTRIVESLAQVEQTVF